ncbi:hypothetical protein B0H13DRAFT_2272224 [Mycena leptocephala]|nr:hypothetical protein B0H13DRAFT_2272224 [Mycena leptocephala]
MTYSKTPGPKTAFAHGDQVRLVTVTEYRVAMHRKGKQAQTKTRSPRAAFRSTDAPKRPPPRHPAEKPPIPRSPPYKRTPLQFHTVGCLPVHAHSLSLLAEEEKEEEDDIEVEELWVPPFDLEGAGLWGGGRRLLKGACEFPHDEILAGELEWEGMWMGDAMSARGTVHTKWIREMLPAFFRDLRLATSFCTNSRAILWRTASAEERGNMSAPAVWSDVLFLSLWSRLSAVACLERLWNVSDRPPDLSSLLLKRGSSE